MPDRQREGAVNALSDVRQEALSLLAGQGDSLAIAGALLMDDCVNYFWPRAGN